MNGRISMEHGAAWLRMLLAVHISAGSIAIVAGFIALFALKGAKLHRRSGIWFVYAMIVMGVIGAVIAGYEGVYSSVVTGLLMAYLATTALTTVRPFAEGARRFDVIAMLFALALALADYGLAAKAATSTTGHLDGMPPFPFLVFATIALLASAGDFRMIRAGAYTGTRRLTRHLWRMTFALWVAVASFFLGQAKVIPKPIRIFPLLAIPPLVVLVALFYWLWRVRVRRSVRGMQVRQPAVIAQVMPRALPPLRPAIK